LGSHWARAAMSVSIQLVSWLQAYAGDGKAIEVAGATVGECIDRLIERYPHLGRIILDEERELQPYIDVAVNGADAYPESLAKTVKDGDEISIMAVISGG
jgi:sulfur-carrier protein